MKALNYEGWKFGIVAPVGSLEWYQQVRAAVVAEGYAEEIDWAQGVKPVTDADVFWREFAWVVINSGMKNAVAEGIWDRVKPCVEAGYSARDQFRHDGKAAAIDYVWKNRVKLLGQYQAETQAGATTGRALDWLRSLPWIGPITCWHLAKNYGLDVAKPDRHLVRIAGAVDVQEFCRRLSREHGSDRVATVDLVIWRACSIGILDSKAVAP